MPDPDPIPKLRVVEEDEPAQPPPVVLRLNPGGALAPEQLLKIAPLPAPAEPAERLKSEVRGHFDGRSIEPGIDAILETPAPAETIEHPWGGEGTRVAGIPYGWFLLIAVLVAGAGAWSIHAMRRGEVKAEKAHEVVREMEEGDEHEHALARRLVDSVETTVERFLAADSIDEILPLIRDPERVKPLIERAWKLKPPIPVKFQRMPLFRPETLDGKPFWVVQAEVAGAPLKSLLLEQTGPAEAKVDWETFVCDQPIPWDRYVKERPTGPALEFRVWAMRDVHFTHEFSDSGHWRCFRLSTRDSKEVIYGYAPAASEVAKMLGVYCDRSPSHIATAILTLRVPEQSASPRGVVIEKIVATRWVRVGAKPKPAE